MPKQNEAASGILCWTQTGNEEGTRGGIHPQGTDYRGKAGAGLGGAARLGRAARAPGSGLRHRDAPGGSRPNRHLLQRRGRARAARRPQRGPPPPGLVDRRWPFLAPQRSRAGPRRRRRDDAVRLGRGPAAGRAGRDHGRVDGARHRDRQADPGGRRRLAHFFDCTFDLTQLRAVLERVSAVGPADDRRLADADAEVGAEFLVPFEALGDGTAGAAVLFQVFLPFREVEFLDAAGNRVEEVLVDAEPFRFALVAEEEVDVLPAVALVRRGLGSVEAELLRAFAVRVVPVEQLDIAGASVAFGQGGDRAEEVFAAAGALQVVEDLDRHRGIGGAEPVAFLRHATEDFLGFGDPGHVHHGLSRLLGGDADDRIAEPEQGQGEDRDDPEPATTGHRFDRDFGHALIIATGQRWKPQCADTAIDTSRRSDNYGATHFQRHGRSPWPIT